MWLNELDLELERLGLEFQSLLSYLAIKNLEIVTVITQKGVTQGSGKDAD